jgi:hypothetical protein
MSILILIMGNKEEHIEREQVLSLFKPFHAKLERRAAIQVLD